MAMHPQPYYRREQYSRTLARWTLAVLCGLASCGCATSRWSLSDSREDGTFDAAPVVSLDEAECRGPHHRERGEQHVIHCAVASEPLETSPAEPPVRSVLRTAKAPSARPQTSPPPASGVQPSDWEAVADSAARTADVSATIEGNDFKLISSITTRVAPPPASNEADAADLMPRDYASEAFAPYGRVQYRSEPYVPWQAYGAPQVTQTFCHRPLYFEEVNVERYGDSAGLLQPVVSAGRFFGTIPLLPYKMALDPPAHCAVDPSSYPPGDDAPRHRQMPPVRLVPALVQTATVVGMVLLIP